VGLCPTTVVGLEGALHGLTPGNVRAGKPALPGQYRGMMLRPRHRATAADYVTDAGAVKLASPWPGAGAVDDAPDPLHICG
jgi:hypothetical protein